MLVQEIQLYQGVKCGIKEKLQLKKEELNYKIQSIKPNEQLSQKVPIPKSKLTREAFAPIQAACH